MIGYVNGLQKARNLLYYEQEMTAIKKFGSLYNEAVEGLCLYNNRLDTYGQGCSHDCKYCYAKSLLQFR